MASKKRWQLPGGRSVRQVTIFSAAVCVAMAALSPLAAVARPLDSTVCADLDKEKIALETAGVANDLRLTPDQAKALAADRLKLVQRYVQVSADVLFRCPIAVVIAPEAAPKDAKPAAAPGAEMAKIATSETAKGGGVKDAPKVTKLSKPVAKPSAAKPKRVKR